MTYLFSSCNSEKPRVLVFSKTAGFYHNSIPDGIEAIQKLGDENGFEVDTTKNAGMFTEENLKGYSAVIFLSTTGDVLNHYQEAEFERYIQAGGGYVGIHAAADTEYQWGWYGRLVGGYFADHPGINDPHPNVQEGTLEVEDKNHPSTEFLPDQWTRTDEWYSYKNFNEDVNVLMTIDEASYQGGLDMGYHPMAWYHEYDGGRAFYTAGGHTSESYSEDLFLQHLLAGIQYAIDDNRRDYSQARTHPVPAENRFTQTQLIPGGELYEPTEMTILPNRDVLIAERRGGIKLYKNGSSTIVEAGHLDVYFETDVPGVNAEEGVIGIKKDPDFENNRFVYIFYSPAGESVNRLSRFRFENDRLDMESEITVLEFYSQRDICCHTGGSIAFDRDGLMYVSTGDNSTPFNQPDQPYVLDGYAPLDERPGFRQYDARRSSGNSNDLRGKILRIRVNEDGSYDIPEGNLYPEGMEKTRPEIYVQGTRNPYRISVDQKNGYLYWGDVGPDAREDSIGVRGPRGYDEVNQAREAGHYGWPLFIGENYPYNEYDYATGTPASPSFDPEKPVNRSPHNTGLTVLPPAEPAFIWYPYAVSSEFPEVGTGGRNAMAGPVYYTDLYPEESRLPEYYDGKLFIYEWIRDWVKVVTLRPNGDFDKMEPFMAGTTFNAIMDMEVGPNGQLYLLEYGKGWFSRNPDSGLSRIDFNAGNRSPVVHEIRADKTSGLTPLEVTFSVEASDPEDDPLSYHWEIGDGETIETDLPELKYAFNEIGEHEVTVEVSDPENLTARSEPVSVYAGNTAPVVHIEIQGNRTFYFPDKPVGYDVRVEDEGPEGVSTAVNPSNLFVFADYIESSGETDEEESTEGHQVMTDVLSGRNLAATLDCRACHHEDQSSIGPSYTRIAE
ncbi:MAG: ThuA domain-containing protein, partial [Balneolaceae bacterium]